MLILLDGKTLESALVEMPMADGAVGVLPTLGVSQRETAHERGEFAVVSRPKNEVPMVGHEAPVEDAHGDALVGQEQDFFEGEIILIFFEESEASVGAIEDMVNQAGGGVSSGSRHESECYRVDDSMYTFASLLVHPSDDSM